MIKVEPLKHGQIANRTDDVLKVIIFGWLNETQSLPHWGTHFGFVHQGPTELHCEAGDFLLKTGMYFATRGALWLRGGAGLIVSRLGQRGFFHIGGPIEKTGRLRYIDGCTDSLLIPPVVRGDACLNLLHVPAGVDQTAHTHPSLRVGLVVNGRGCCRSVDGEVTLSTGKVFQIEANEVHSFHTKGCQLRIVAFHPDSDFGSTDEDHLMLNRTIVKR